MTRGLWRATTGRFAGATIAFATVAALMVGTACSAGGNTNEPVHGAIEACVETARNIVAGTAVEPYWDETQARTDCAEILR